MKRQDSNWQITCNQNTEKTYHPPLAGNGQLSLMVDHQGTQIQQKWHDMEPVIYWAGRRYDSALRELVPFGYFEQDIRQSGVLLKQPQSWQQTLDIKQASITSHCTYDGNVAVQAKTVVHADLNLICLSRCFTAEKPLDFTLRYTLAQPGSREAPRRMTWSAAETDDGVITIDYQIDGQYAYAGRICLPSDQPGHAQIANNCFSLRFKTEIHPIKCYILMSDNLESDDYCERLATTVKKLRGEGYNKLEQAHVDAWQAYWEESTVTLPENDIEAVYRTALHHLRCNATPWSQPVAITSKHWHGRYFAFDEHFALLGLLTSNHLQLARRVTDFRFQGLGKAYQRASRYGQKLFPGGARYPWETVETGDEAAPAGFWLDHIFHMAQVALSCWQDFRFSTAGSTFPFRVAWTRAWPCSAAFSPIPLSCRTGSRLMRTSA